MEIEMKNIPEPYAVVETTSRPAFSHIPRLRLLHILRTDTGKSVDLPISGEVFLTSANMKIDCAEIYREYYELTADEIFVMTHNGMDRRTDAYLSACLKKIGFLRETAGYDEAKIEGGAQVACGVDAIGKVMGGTEWVWQRCQRSGCDDYVITQLFFDHFPSSREINDALTVLSVRDTFLTNDFSPVRDCWECGREHHWLDADIQGLREKWEAFWCDGAYCGC
jgi:hypothetical protein